VIARVQDLIRKRNFPRDAEGRVLEDALCLVFLGDAVRRDHGQNCRREDDRHPAKDMAKNDATGAEIALTLPMSTEQRVLVEKALAGSPVRGE